jgi:hypothetical protein
VVVAVAAVRVVQVAVDEVVRVIAVRHRFVAAAWSVLMILGMPAATVGRRASGGIGGVHLQAVLLNTLGRRVVQVAVVKVIDVPVMLDALVAAVGPVLVSVACVVLMAHDLFS